MMRRLTLIDGKLCGDFDKFPRCESCDDDEIKDVFISEGSEWMLVEKTSLTPMSDSQSPTLIVLMRSAIICQLCLLSAREMGNEI